MGSSSSKKTENTTMSRFSEGQDVRDKFDSALAHAADTFDFTPTEEPQLTGFWVNNQYGAANIRGVFNTNGIQIKARLKIQGVEMQTPEVDMIAEFARQNTGKVVRPPKIYRHAPWSQERKFELILMEDVQGYHPILEKPATPKEFDNFFACLEDFSNTRSKLIPWTTRPEKFPFSQRYQSVLDNYSHREQKTSLLTPADYELGWKGIKLLESKYSSPEDTAFTHKHFEPGSLLILDRGSPMQAVLFANLFWGWVPKHYELIFAYHWHMLGMEHAPALTRDTLEKERARWLERIQQLSVVGASPIENRNLSFAFLERAISALTADIHLVTVSEEHTKIIYEGAKAELRRLIAICEEL